MDKEFLKTQLEEIDMELGKVRAQEAKDLERQLQVVRSFILSVLNPEEFNDTQREDVRRLAQELRYSSDTDFSEWWHQVLVA